MPPAPPPLPSVLKTRPGNSNYRVKFVDSDEDNDDGRSTSARVSKLYREDVKGEGAALSMLLADPAGEPPTLIRGPNMKQGKGKALGVGDPTQKRAVLDKDDVAAATAQFQEADRLEKIQSTLVDKVNLLESGLAKALSAYRAQAEEELANHLAAMEELTTLHDMELSNLRVENFKLREKLGLLPEQTQAEKVLFQTAVKEEANKGKKRSGRDREDERKKAISTNDDDDDNKGLSMRKAKKKDAAPAGTWQPFVAWVPNGAALGNPEPWKPLSQQDIAAATTGGHGKPQSHAGPLRKSRSTLSIAAKANAESDSPSNATVLPGEVKDDKHSDSDEDSDKTSDISDQDRFYMLQIWEPTAQQKKGMKGRSSQGDTESSVAFQDEDEDFVHDKAFFILNPDSNPRIMWDLCSLFMVIYDCIMIPMIAFEMDENDPFLTLMDWATRLFWTTDMGWSCVTGVGLADGTVEFNFKAILKHYAKTWLALDLFIVASDWSTVGMSSGEMGMSRLGRVFRVARVVRLLRLVRMQEIIANITERIQSDKLGLIMQIGKCFVLISFLSHVIACGWWSVGTADPVNQWAAPNYNTAETDIGTKYLVSLHWASSQFAGGMDEVSPKNTLERFYAVVAGLGCFMTTAVMLSTLTSSLTQQYIIGGSGARQMANLRKYLKQNKCTKNLSKRLCRNAKHAISGDLTADAVELLNVISEPLKIEMHYEMYSRILAWHPFFLELLAGAHNQLMRWTCHRAVSMLLLAHGDVVFSRGEEATDPKMYFVASGELEYLDAYGEVVKVSEKMYVAEMALWTTWRHRGTLTAVSDVKMALLDSQSFQDVCKRYFRKSKDSAFFIKTYASDFLDELNANALDASDLPGS